MYIRNFLSDHYTDMVRGLTSTPQLRSYQKVGLQIDLVIKKAEWQIPLY